MSSKQLMPLSIRLPKDLYDRLDQFCEKYHIERPQAVRLALTVFFDQYEQAGSLLPKQEPTMPEVSSTYTRPKFERKTGDPYGPIKGTGAALKKKEA